MKKIISLFIIIIIGSCLQAQESSFPNRLSYSFDPLYEPFYHGVASGDALSDKIIIWTRVTSFTAVDSINVDWYFATDSSCTNIIQSGNIWAKPERDFCVKIDVSGLQSDTWYYYFFKAQGKNSVVGRTKTMPVGNCDSLRFALVSGSNYNSGYYNAYRAMADRNDLDGIIHLGDYIYEYETDGYGNHHDRDLMPTNEIISLSDYRMRYSHYRLDPDLKYLHQQYPWYVIWDDHEIANNGYMHGAENHSSSTEGPWSVRFNAGIKAFMEWIPIREPNDSLNPANKIHRTIEMGNLASLYLLDTRYEARDKQDSLSNNSPNKTMLGVNQYNWITQELYDAQYQSNIQWKILGNQVMFVPLLVFGAVVNDDQWDGYQYEKQRLMDFMYGWSIDNVVIITGDIHTSWANDVPNSSRGTYGSNGAGCECVEIVTPSITSPSTNSFFGGIGSATLKSMNPHMKWIDLSERGYVVLDVNQSKVQADWYFVNTIDVTSFTESLGSAWYVNDGERFLRQAVNPSVRLTPNPSLTSELPKQIITSIESPPTVIIGAYPNPFNNTITIQYYRQESNEVSFVLTDINGKIVFEEVDYGTAKDLDYFTLKTNNIVDGVYFLTVSIGNAFSATKKLIKITK